MFNNKQQYGDISTRKKNQTWKSDEERKRNARNENFLNLLVIGIIFIVGFLRKSNDKESIHFVDACGEQKKTSVEKV